ncbi:MAG: hypothetical protein IPG89_02965 [Bacteroidetes bacterium]|nr:hypothetical protein [Bacteroidota bacterium]
MDYIDNANLLLNEEIEADLIQGKGCALGVIYKKNKGKLTGWIVILYLALKENSGLSKDEWYFSLRPTT